MIHQTNIIKIIKKDYEKNFVKMSKSFYRRKRKKKRRCGVNNTKIYQKMKSKCLLSIEKVII